MIDISHLSFAYGRRGAAVFDDFSLTLESGGIYGLLGKNGTGKSTLLYLIAGLLRPNRGSVRFLGQETRSRRPELLEELFLLPEEFTLPPVTLKHFASLNSPFYPHFSDELFAQCLRDFDLAPGDRLDKLSMGQRKKAFVSFALATNTRLLLMDEPTNGLDIPSKSQFRRVVARSMSEGRTLIVSTHQIHDVEALLDRVVALDRGRLLLDRSVADICDRLYFEERPAGSPVDDALYVQPTVHGNAIVRLNSEGADSPLNLELLFSALLERPDLWEQVTAKR